MKKVLAIIFVLVLILQAGAVTVFAENAAENEQVITISDIRFSSSEESDSSTEIQTVGLPGDAVEIVSEEWSCPDEIVISGENIEITGGQYSYKLTLRSNGTLTFDNDLEIYYQGINGRYQLNYEIDETDNHIMIVTGTFDNIIIESPLLDKIPDKGKNWIISHISEDSYFYKLILRTAEGFSFTNCLRFLFDSEPTGYTMHYTYDLLKDEQSLVINGIKDCGEAEQEAQTVDGEETESKTEADVKSDDNTETAPAAIHTVSQTSDKAVNEPEVEDSKAEAELTSEQTSNEPEVNGSKSVVKLTSKQALSGFELKDSKRIVKAGRTTFGATVLNRGLTLKTFRIKEVSNKKYAGYFTINKLTGSIKVNSKTPRGRYVVTVQAKELMTKNSKAGDWKTADVAIVVI